MFTFTLHFHFVTLNGRPFRNPQLVRYNIHTFYGTHSFNQHVPFLKFCFSTSFSIPLPLKTFDTARTPPRQSINHPHITHQPPLNIILKIYISSNQPKPPNQTQAYFNLIINILVNLIHLFFCHFVMPFCFALTSDICYLELPSSIEFWRKKN